MAKTSRVPRGTFLWSSTELCREFLEVPISGVPSLISTLWEVYDELCKEDLSLICFILDEIYERSPGKWWSVKTLKGIINELLGGHGMLYHWYAENEVPGYEFDRYETRKAWVLWMINQLEQREDLQS